MTVTWSGTPSGPQWAGRPGTATPRLGCGTEPAADRTDGRPCCTRHRGSVSHRPLKNIIYLRTELKNIFLIMNFLVLPKNVFPHFCPDLPLPSKGPKHLVCLSNFLICILSLQVHLRAGCACRPAWHQQRVLLWAYPWGPVWTGVYSPSAAAQTCSAWPLNRKWSNNLLITPFIRNCLMEPVMVLFWCSFIPIVFSNQKCKCLKRHHILSYPQ